MTLHAIRESPVPIRWGSVIPGVLCAVAIQMVLGLFGAAFGFSGDNGGLVSLAAVWEVLTPVVALLVGSAMAVSLGGRRSPYLNGFMVWCLFLAAIAFYLGRNITIASARAGAMGLPAGSATALAGLSALLGLAGAIVGSSIGKRVARYELARKRDEEEESESAEAPPVHH